jgi:mRNA deadenylase 3'-5' endonuclease subunit Ccr4
MRCPKIFLSVKHRTTQVSQPILVCSAHIHWDPEFCDVKLIQTMMLMEQLRQIVESCHNLRSLSCFKNGSIR